MAEGDFGEKLPITVYETTLTEHDALKLTFKKNKNGGKYNLEKFMEVSS